MRNLAGGQPLAGAKESVEEDEKIVDHVPDSLALHLMASGAAGALVCVRVVGGYS